MASIRNLEAPKTVMLDRDGMPLPLWYQWFALVGNVLVAMTSSGTTAQRPTKFLWVGRNYWNTTLAQMEWYDGASWVTWSGGGGGAPTNASYVTMALNATLTNERVLTAGTNITITDGGANGPVTIAAATGAPSTATYVTMTTDAGLANERTLAVGSPLTLSDGGAGNPVTLDFDETVTLGNNARVAVSRNSGATVGTRRRLNFIEGTNVTLTIADDPGNEEVDVTINASGGGGGGSVTSGSATVDFGFAAALEGDIASVSVALPSVLSTSEIAVSPRYLSTLPDHDAEDYAIEGITATVGAVTAGVGFDIYAYAPAGTWGRYNVDYLVNV